MTANHKEQHDDRAANDAAADSNNDKTTRMKRKRKTTITSKVMVKEVVRLLKVSSLFLQLIYLHLMTKTI